MIISASRRTDLPAFYLDWFLNRLREGFALTQNPMNKAQVRRISLLREDVRCFVFWSKNPAPLLRRLKTLDGFPFYIQYTLNAYGPDLEPGVPPLNDRLDVFRRLADATSTDHMVWRYDPILLSPTYPVAFHEDRFAQIAGELSQSTGAVTVSFLDLYAKIAKNLRVHGMRRPDEAEIHQLARSLSRVAKSNHLSIQTCAEIHDLSLYGISRACCVDTRRIERLTGLPCPRQKDKNQRPACGCAPSVDIGSYHTCLHGCAYCYATAGTLTAKRNHARHNPSSPLLS